MYSFYSFDPVSQITQNLLGRSNEYNDTSTLCVWDEFKTSSNTPFKSLELDTHFSLVRTSILRIGQNEPLRMKLTFQQEIVKEVTVSLPNNGAHGDATLGFPDFTVTEKKFLVCSIKNLKDNSEYGCLLTYLGLVSTQIQFKVSFSTDTNKFLIGVPYYIELYQSHNSELPT